MKPVFGDTVYFLALLSPADQWHAQALSLSLHPPGLLITTEFVLAEVGDGLSRRQKTARSSPASCPCLGTSLMSKSFLPAASCSAKAANCTLNVTIRNGRSQTAPPLR